MKAPILLSKVEGRIPSSMFERAVAVALSAPTKAILDHEARAAEMRERLGEKWICHQNNRIERLDGRRPAPREIPEFLRVVK